MASADESFDQFEDEDAAEPSSGGGGGGGDICSGGGVVGGGGVSGGSGGVRKRLFSKELRCMMYGFGDDQNPYTESVDMLEDIVVEFITQMTQQAMEVGRSGRVQVEDVLYLVRKDKRKNARVHELLNMNEELKKARKAFDEIKYAGVS